MMPRSPRIADDPAPPDFANTIVALGEKRQAADPGGRGFLRLVRRGHQ